MGERGHHCCCNKIKKLKKYGGGGTAAVAVAAALLRLLLVRMSFSLAPYFMCVRLVLASLLSVVPHCKVIISIWYFIMHSPLYLGKRDL